VLLALCALLASRYLPKGVISTLCVIPFITGCSLRFHSVSSGMFATLPFAAKGVISTLCVIGLLACGVIGGYFFPLVMTVGCLRRYLFPGCFFGVVHKSYSKIIR